jgi:hypothetical protein
MRRIITAGLAAAVALSLGLAAASAKANFTGTWTLDLAKSAGLPPNIKAQTLTVKQTGDRIEITTKVTTDEGEQNQTDVYTVDGKEADFTPKGPGGMEGKGKRTSTWTADGNGIDVKEASTFETPGGAVDVKIMRKWALSADGKTLTIDVTAETPMGTQNLKRVFTKG